MVQIENRSLTEDSLPMRWGNGLFGLILNRDSNTPQHHLPRNGFALLLVDVFTYDSITRV